MLGFLTIEWGDKKEHIIDTLLCIIRSLTLLLSSLQFETVICDSMGIQSDVFYVISLLNRDSLSATGGSVLRAIEAMEGDWKPL